jgi:L-2-hydroxyglutarate oxidase
MQATEKSDILIIGGGIVGLATAYQLSLRHPDRSLAIVEKEKSLAAHQTGHNSGVLHTGIYYKPGSLKAKNCREGKLAMQQFCEEHAVQYDICGKVIVAVNDKELPALHNIFDRGKENQVKCELINRDRLLELEPHSAGVKAIHVPEAGIVNYRQVCERLSEIVRSKGHRVLLETKVTGIRTVRHETIVSTNRGEFATDLIVNCAGLHCDRIIERGGQQPAAKIIPFRGEYFKLVPDMKHLCRNLIYPVPDPKFPFLGVHFTRMINGEVECGPNAVLAFDREGYKKTDVNFRDLIDAITYPGFIRMTAKHWRMGMGEMWRSFSKQAFVKALQRLMPEIRAEHLVPADAGIRAQAVLPTGGLVDDFLIVDEGRMVSINNAPSPAATASLNIGNLIVDKLEPHFH